MKAYNQTDQFWLCVNAAGNPSLTPDASLLQRFKEKRIARAVKALKGKNIFLFTEGTRTSADLNDITTVYTQPAGVRLLVVGYSDNFFYGMTRQRFTDIPIGVNPFFGTYVDVNFPQTHRVRIVGRENRDLSDDFLMAQSGASGQPRYTSDRFPAPFILEADEQLAIDLGYDTANAEISAVVAEAFCFFCVKVKDKLTAEDYAAIEEIKYYIATHDYQRGIFLNCATQARDDVLFSTAVAGGTASCQTRPANGPLMITGIGTTLFASALRITDTSDGHSFSLNRNMVAGVLNIADNAVKDFVPVACKGGAPVWTYYFDFPAPHLLRPGALLKCEVVNGDVDASGNPSVDSQTGNIILFQGLTV